MHSDAEGFFRSFRSVHHLHTCCGARLTESPNARYDAHPMSMLTSAFAMLGSYYSEANPSLRGMTMPLPKCVSLMTCDIDFSGQRLYTQGDAASLANMDRQIYRLIGKATTLAA